MFESGREKIAFSSRAFPDGVTWSKNLALSEDGLVSTRLPSNQSQDIWILTHPFPIGMAWRPPSSASFTVSMEGTVNSVPSVFPTPPEVSLRYSPDKVNWSTWYLFTIENRPSGNVYKLSISLPKAAYDRYQTLMRDWWQTKPNWPSDENAFCEWLIKKDPDFFVTEKPFIGYVQIRFDKENIGASQNIREIVIDYGWGVSGLGSPVNDKAKMPDTTDTRWHFLGKIIR